MKKFSQLSINEAFDFRQTETSKADKLYLYLLFEGGDGDTEHPEWREFRNIKFSEYKNHLDEINELVDKYKTLSKILDVNSREYSEDYDEVKDKYGEEMARMWENVPGDPQVDYQRNCWLYTIKLVGFDEKGNKHEAYVR